MERPFKVGPYRSKGEVIGKGSYSTVFKAININTEEKVAIKVVDLYKLSSRQPSKYRNLKNRLKMEIEIAKSVDHPHLVKMIDVLEEDERVYLVFEFCEYGDLASYLEDVGVLNEKNSKVFLRQIISGLSYLHSQNIIHRDLKPQNILMKKNGDEFKLKIADFGFAKRVEPQDMSATVCGSPLYMAPQLLDRLEYSPKADIWSLGVVMYEMVTGNKPVDASNPMELIKNIRQHKILIPSYLSRDCQSLLKGLLRKDEDRRFNILEVSSHSFFPSKEKEFTYFKRTHSFPSNKINKVVITSSQLKLTNSVISTTKQSQNENTQSYIRIICELFYGVEELQNITSQNTVYNSNVLVYIYTICLLTIHDIILEIKNIVSNNFLEKYNQIPKIFYKIVNKCIYRYEQLRLSAFQLKTNVISEDKSPSLANIIYKNVIELERKSDDPRTDILLSSNCIQSAIVLLSFLHKQQFVEVNRENINKEISRFMRKKRLIKKRGNLSSSSLIL